MPMASEELQPEELSALLSSLMPEIPGYRVLRRIGRGGMLQRSPTYIINLPSKDVIADTLRKNLPEQMAHDRC